MIRRLLRTLSVLPLAALAACIAATGCEHDESIDSFSWGESAAPKQTPKANTAPTGGATAFVGTWNLFPDKGGANWYGIFNADGTWLIADNADGSKRRVYGRYRVTGDRLEGDMTNPGVGTGAITASISPGGIMALMFVEHWHEPHKTVTYSGSKL